MKRLKKILLGGVLILTSMFCSETKAQVLVDSGDLVLWYKQAATEWTKALPIGNGRLGAMVYGGVQLEHLQLNEETLWSGGPHNYDNPNAYQHLSEVRDLLDKGEYIKAEDVSQKMMGNPVKQMAYQPFGDLFLMFPQGEKSHSYRHELNLQTAVNKVTYSLGLTNFTRTTFASEPDQAIVMKIESDGKKQVSFDLLLTSPHKSVTQVNDDPFKKGQTKVFTAN